MSKFLFAAILAFLPSLAFAHTGTGVVAGFVSGLLHPLSGADHALAALAIGLWAARDGSIDGVAAFCSAVAFGLVGGILIGEGSAFEVGLVSSVLLAGMILALDWRLPKRIAFAVFAAFGAVHGHAHGVELTNAFGSAGQAFGIVIATSALAVIGFAAGRSIARPIFWRAIGAATAAGSIAIAVN